MDQLIGLTEIHRKPGGILPASEQLIAQVTNISNNEMYHRIDQLLVNCIGQSMQFTQLIQHIQTQDAAAYDWVIGRSQRILNPTYALP